MNKYKDRKFKELSQDEIKHWNDFVNDNKEKIITWSQLCSIKIGRKKNSKSFIKKLPYDTTTPLRDRINWGFIAEYYQSTGIPPYYFFHKIEPLFNKLGVYFTEKQKRMFDF